MAMSVKRIRAHYGSLNHISQTFQHQAEAVQQTVHDLTEKESTLQSGGWQGEAADKFYAEMDSAVTPALKRLATALELSATQTQKISQLMKQAEAEVAQLFKAQGGAGGGVGGLGAGIAAMTADKGGGGSPTVSNPQPSKGGGAKTGGAKSSNPKGSSTQASNVPFKKELFDKLGPKVQKVAEQSPTLMQELNDLSNKRWDAGVLPPSKKSPDTPSETFVVDKKLNIYLKKIPDPNLKAEDGTLRLAHEAGIAKFNPPLVKADQPGMTEDKYVKTNLPLIRQAEGEGLFNEIVVRNEIGESSGKKTDIGLTDPHSEHWPEYQKLFEAEQNKTITHTEAVNKMLDIYETGVKESNDGDDLNALYTKALKDDWAEFKRTGKAPPI